MTKLNKKGVCDNNDKVQNFKARVSRIYTTNVMNFCNNLNDGATTKVQIVLAKVNHILSVSDGQGGIHTCYIFSSSLSSTFLQARIDSNFRNKRMVVPSSIMNTIISTTKKSHA